MPVLSRAARWSAAHPWRTVLAWLVIALPLALAGGVGQFAVSTDDTARFLPSDAPSRQALEIGGDEFGLTPGTSTVTVLVERVDGRALGGEDRAAVESLRAVADGWRPDVDALEVEDEFIDLRDRAGAVLSAAAGPSAPDGRFVLVGLQWRANTIDPVAHSAFRQLRAALTERAGRAGLRLGFTGGVASVNDADEAQATRTAVQSGLLVAAIVGLSFLFLRGVLAAVLPLLVVGLVAGAAGGLIVLAAAVSGVELDVGTTQVVSVVLIGIGVDYFLFLLFRVRELLRAGEPARVAAADAGARIAPVIGVAALVLAVAFSTLTLASFGQFRLLGPSIAVSVGVMLIAGVTLMPAVAALAGPRLFWPSRRWRAPEADGWAERLGGRVARAPGRAALAATGLLAVLAAFAVATQLDYDLGASGPDTAATRTAERISDVLPSGTADPQPVFVRARAELDAAELDALRTRLAAAPGVADASEPVLAEGRRAALIDVVLDDEPTSAAAMDTIRGPVRVALDEGTPPGATAAATGDAAVLADVSDAVERDMRLVLPLAALLIAAVLLAALRSVRTAGVLLAVVALEFAATLGAAVLVVQLVGGEPGVSFTLPLVIFLFVVAVGTDYNVLVTARLREELRSDREPRQAVAAAVRHAAPAITAAGLVLAASFATLILAPDSGTRETGFALAVGILIAALVVSTVLVPSLAALSARRRDAPPPRSETEGAVA